MYECYLINKKYCSTYANGTNEKKEAFRIAGISCLLEKKFEKNFKELSAMWQKAIADGTIPKLVEFMKGEPMGVLGVSICTNAEAWRYFIAVVSKKEIDSSLEEYMILATVWAVFPSEGTGIVGKTD